jgi:hypothetical protein
MMRCLALVLASAPIAAAQPGTTRLYVFGTDRTGAAAEDLSVADFNVQENGAACRVMGVRHGTAPMRVVVLVDNSDAIAIDPLRKSLRELISRVPDDAEVGLATIAGGGYDLQVAPTLDRPRLEKSVNSLDSDGGGPHVAESLMQADAALFRDRVDRWPVFVLVTADSGVNTMAVKQIEFDALSNHLQAVAASVHAAVLVDAGNSPDMNWSLWARLPVLERRSRLAPRATASRFSPRGGACRSGASVVAQRYLTVNGTWRDTAAFSLAALAASTTST